MCVSVLQLNLNNIFHQKKYNRITRVLKMKSIIISILSNTRMAVILHNLIKYKSGGRYRSICNRIRESKRVCVKWNKWVDIFDGKIRLEDRSARVVMRNAIYQSRVCYCGRIAQPRVKAICNYHPLPNPRRLINTASKTKCEIMHTNNYNSK